MSNDSLVCSYVVSMCKRGMWGLDSCSVTHEEEYVEETNVNGQLFMHINQCLKRASSRSNALRIDATLRSLLGGGKDW